MTLCHTMDPLLQRAPPPRPLPRHDPLMHHVLLTCHDPLMCRAPPTRRALCAGPVHCAPSRSHFLGAGVLYLN